MSIIEPISEVDKARQRREASRRGGLARAAQPSFQEHQRRAGKRSAEVNDMGLLGHKGAMAFIEKYGYPKLYRLARDWRLGHPSRYERQMMAMLDEMAVRYEREVELLGEQTFVSVDFYLPDTGHVIEINGKVHYDPLFDHPNYPNTRQANDVRRMERLRKAGYAVLVLDYREMGVKRQDELRDRVVEFVGSQGN